MQGPLRIFSLLVLTAFLATGCGRKKPTTTGANPAEAPTAAETTGSSEAQSTDVTAPGNSSGQPQVDIPPDAPVATTPGNLSADLAKSDEVYDAWFRKYQLDLNDPKMLDSDADGDGVSNRDEFMADTNPRDAKSRPASSIAATESHAALRLKQYNEVRLPIILESVQGGTAKIKRLDGSEKIETVKEGQMVPGLNYKVEKVQSRRGTDKHGSAVDASRITLEESTTQEKTILVKDMPARAASSYAVLTSEDGSSSITVKQGDTFTWPKEGGVTYQVIDLRSDQAVLQEEASGRMYTVTKQ
jgi:hypothetical protein